MLIIYINGKEVTKLYQRNYVMGNTMRPNNISRPYNAHVNIGPGK